MHVRKYNRYTCTCTVYMHACTHSFNIAPSHARAGISVFALLHAAARNIHVHAHVECPYSYESCTCHELMLN